ncbi:MAG: NADH-quinone oxidoreductase subunit N, partial [Candidatus Kapabacteria bacterium]|nr:NADH-quinone oxidoreductase subunit N [Candidatus Kapabacteria bacterium]
SFATGFLLYGMAMIYGATGSMDLTIISAKIVNGNINSQNYLTLGFAMILIGLSFKAAAFPFHQWAPDVYSGSPTVVTAFMSTAGKAAAMIAFIIVARSLMPYGIHDAQTLLMTQKAQLVIAIISALTMLIGNITALVQKNIKRMLAYSSVAHAGYLLMGIVANNSNGWKGIVFYSSAYMLMQIGAFVVLSVLEKDTDKNLELSDYAGLSKKHPALAAMMTIFMLSLAGIPPMAGFFGKYMIFASAIQAGFVWLVIVAVISSIISVYFYIGLIVYMYFKEPVVELEGEAGSANIALYLATFGILFLGILPFLLDDLLTKII